MCLLATCSGLSCQMVPHLTKTPQASVAGARHGAAYLTRSAPACRGAGHACAWSCVCPMPMLWRWLGAGGAGLPGGDGVRSQLRVGEPLQHDLPGAAGLPEAVRPAGGRPRHARRLRRLAQHRQGGVLLLHTLPLWVHDCHFYWHVAAASICKHCILASMWGVLHCCSLLRGSMSFIRSAGRHSPPVPLL